MLGLALFALLQWEINAEICADSGNLPQQHMNACAAWDFEQADAELNVVWDEVLAYARGDLSYMPEGDDRGSAEQHLVGAQRAWIALRDEHCLVWSFHMRGGSAEPLLYHGCRSAMTRARTEELRSLMIEE